ncbi:polyamine transporter 4 [Cladorrhinum sp. PSN332]|nr:polyamine transporter 4 [Cladorrhinum sp. PSN332]
MPPEAKYIDSTGEGETSDSTQSPPVEMSQTSQVLDWDSPDDPDNPKNWPKWKKILHSAMPSIYAFGLTTSISTLVAGIPFIMQDFNVSRTVALLPVTFYTFGFVIGPCIASPISELYGRRWIYLSNFIMLLTFNAIAAASNSFPALVVFRFLAALGGSGVLAVGAATLSDVWDMKSAGRVGIFYILAPFLGPTLGPLIGAYILGQHNNDWKWSIWVILCILAPLTPGFLMMKETSKDIILQQRAKKRGTADFEKHESFGIELGKIGRAVLRPLHMCAIEPLLLFMGLYTAFSFAMTFSLFGSYVYVYQNVYGFDSKQIGLCYIAVVVGYIFALATFVYFDATKYRPEAARTGGKVAPEYRLYTALVGCWLVPIGLFWYAWTPRPSVHWMVPVMAGLPFGWGTLANFLSAMTYIVETYGTANSASAVASNGVVRFTLGAVFPLFILQVYEGVGIHWAGSIFAFISVAFIPVPWVFFVKGKELRRRSHYPTNPN